MTTNNKMKNKHKHLTLVDKRKRNQREAGCSDPSIAKQAAKRQKEANGGEPAQEEAAELSEESDAPPPRRRGPTLMRHIWGMKKGVRVRVQLGHKSLPLGYEACTLTRFIGTMVRRSNFAPNKSSFLA